MQLRSIIIFNYKIQKEWEWGKHYFGKSRFVKTFLFDKTFEKKKFDKTIIMADLDVWQRSLDIDRQGGSDTFSCEKENNT